GVRPHEIYHLDLSRLEGEGIVKVLKGKTGSRLIWPCKAKWVKQFELTKVYAPVCGTDTSNKRLGERTGKAFKRSRIP
ncbi:MAG: site-specific integrase, partial [Cyanobacteria bacterium J06639_14]